MSAIFAVGNPSAGAVAVKIGTPRGRVIRITVLTPGQSIRLANNPTDLNTPPSATGGLSGQIVTQLGGQVQQIWDGELWALGVPTSFISPAQPTMVDFDILDDNKGAGYPLNP